MITIGSDFTPRCSNHRTNGTPSLPGPHGKATAPTGGRKRSQRSASGSSPPDQSTAAKRREIRCKLGSDPRQIEHAGDLAYRMIVGYDLVEMELIEKLLLLVLQPPHHRLPPQLIASERQNHCPYEPATEFCNKICQNATSCEPNCPAGVPLHRLPAVQKFLANPPEPQRGSRWMV